MRVRYSISRAVAGTFVASVVLTAATGSPAGAATRALALGAYAGSDSIVSLRALEDVVGSSLAIASSFRGWGDEFPDAAQRQQASAGHRLLVAWDLGATSATRFVTFTQGVHDDYLAREAAAARDFGRTFYIRPWAEMNADWVPFQPTSDGNRTAGGTYAQFIAAWRYLVTFFRTHGATNVRWVFNPTTDTYSQTTLVSRIWPGIKYVDVLGLDGYNWGTGSGLVWRTFADIYTTQYQRLTALAPGLPVWICEFGSKEPREDDGAPVDPAHAKGAWYAQMRVWLDQASHVQALVMFDVRKERDWRIETDPRAVAQMAAIATGGV